MSQPSALINAENKRTFGKSFHFFAPPQQGFIDNITDDMRPAFACSALWQMSREEQGRDLLEANRRGKIFFPLEDPLHSM